jgi:hypothetical protein
LNEVEELDSFLGHQYLVTLHVLAGRITNYSSHLEASIPFQVARNPNTPLEVANRGLVVDANPK